MSTGSCTLSNRVAVAGPTPVKVVRCLRASVGNDGNVEVVLVGGDVAAKALLVADLTKEGSFLRIWAGRKGRFVPWVL
jgi:hypothetical protein